MSETMSQDIRRLTDFSPDLEQRNPTQCIFQNGAGRILFKEAVPWETPRSISTSWSYEGQGFSEPRTIGAAPIQLKIPRVRKVGGQTKERYILLKKYQGFVSSRGETSFTARLFEKANDYPVIEAEFDLEELSETDRKLAVEGSALVWTIGYHENGPRRRESLIYIRRRPGWTEREAKESVVDSEALTSDINWK